MGSIPLRRRLLLIATLEPLFELDTGSSANGNDGKWQAVCFSGLLFRNVAEQILQIRLGRSLICPTNLSASTRSRVCYNSLKRVRSNQRTAGTPDSIVRSMISGTRGARRMRLFGGLYRRRRLLWVFSTIPPTSACLPSLAWCLGHKGYSAGSS